MKKLWFYLLGVLVFCGSACSAGEIILEKESVVVEEAVFSLTFAKAQKDQQRIGAGAYHNVFLKADGEVICLLPK